MLFKALGHQNTLTETLPSAAAKRCCQALLPSAAAKRCCQALLPSAPAKRSCHFKSESDDNVECEKQIILDYVDDSINFSRVAPSLVLLIQLVIKGSWKFSNETVATHTREWLVTRVGGGGLQSNKYCRWSVPGIKFLSIRNCGFNSNP